MKTNALITGKCAKEMVDQKHAKLIDVRTPVEVRDGTLPNAVNVPLRAVSSLMTKYKKTDTLIFFGASNADDNIIHSIKYARQMGFDNVYNLGNMENWFRK